MKNYIYACDKTGINYPYIPCRFCANLITEWPSVTYCKKIVNPLPKKGTMNCKMFKTRNINK